MIMSGFNARIGVKSTPDYMKSVGTFGIGSRSLRGKRLQNSVEGNNNYNNNKFMLPNSIKQVLDIESPRGSDQTSNLLHVFRQEYHKEL